MKAVNDITQFFLRGMKKMFAETARTASSITPDQFAAFKAGEVAKYQKLAREAGIKAE